MLPVGTAKEGESKKSIGLSLLSPPDGRVSSVGVCEKERVQSAESIDEWNRKEGG